MHVSSTVGKAKSERSGLLIHPHQRCGYSDLPFARKDTFLYCRVQKWVGGVANRVTNKLYPRKRHFFVTCMEKYIEDARQEEKDVPDLLEAIMRPTDPVKEELRQKLFKLSQFGSKITKIKISTFWIPEIRCFPAGGQCQASRPLGFKQF